MSGPARRFHGSADCGDDPARGRLCAPWFLSTRILTLIKGPARHRFAVPSRAPLQIRADGWPPRCGQARLSAGLDNDPRLHRGSRNWAESCGSSTHAQRTLAAPWPPGARESRMSAEQCLLCWTFFSSNGCGVEAPLPWALPRERGPDWYNAWLVDLFPDTEPAEHDLHHHPAAVPVRRGPGRPGPARPRRVNRRRTSRSECSGTLRLPPCTPRAALALPRRALPRSRTR